MKPHPARKGAAILLVVALFAIGGLYWITQLNAFEHPPAAQKIDGSITAPARALSSAFAAVASAVKPAVVSVYSEKVVKMSGGDSALPFGDNFFQRFFGQEFPRFQSPGKPRQHEFKVPQHGMGSGMILDEEGHILTNNHVVRDVDEIKVQLADNREFPARIVGTDAKTDMAIIQIKGKVPANLPMVKLGDSDALKVGDWVLAIGAPFGLKQTVTAGIISATGRASVGAGDYEDSLQTDAAVNPGNSGGPLVNMDGEVIGMNTAIASNTGQFAGAGFAIPVNTVKNYLPTLIKGGSIVRGFIGVVIQDVTDELAKKFKLANDKGALIAQVNKGSPADKAGLKAGDVILTYDGKAVEDTRGLRKLVAATGPGSEATFTVMRSGSVQNLRLTIGRMPENALASAGEGNEPGSLGRLGLSVEPLTPDTARQFGYQGQHGVVISSVEPGSVAALANLQPGDLITEADRKPVASVEEINEAVAHSKDGVLLLVKRKEASLFVVLNTR